jgi:hypothetical protein
MSQATANQKPSTAIAELGRPMAVGFGDLLASPKRIQLSRKKGWKLPPNTVVVSRPSKWGNPFRVDEFLGKTRAWATNAFRCQLQRQPETIKELQQELRGKNLACWCPLNEPCHADILLRLANIIIHPKSARLVWGGFSQES